MERITLEQQKSTAFEREISREQIENLPDFEEPGAFYRGLTAEEAMEAIFGKLKLNANPEKDPVGPRDNATINLHDAIAFAKHASETKNGKKFLCAIGFNPLSNTIVEKGRLSSTHARITGPVIAKEVILRFAGKKPGKPQKTVKYLSPKEFYQWYQENI